MKQRKVKVTLSKNGNILGNGERVGNWEACLSGWFVAMWMDQKGVYRRCKADTKRDLRNYIKGTFN